MENFNTGISIDIDEISDEDKKRAFHEWAEGSKELEELLFVCYESGLATVGCCCGDPERHPKMIELIDPEGNHYFEKNHVRTYISIIIKDNQMHYMQAIYDKLKSTKQNIKLRLFRDPDDGKIIFSVFPELEIGDEVFSLICETVKMPNFEFEHTEEFKKFVDYFKKQEELVGEFKEESIFCSEENCQDSRLKIAISRVLEKFKIRNWRHKLEKRQKELPAPKRESFIDENPFVLADEELKKFEENAQNIARHGNTGLQNNTTQSKIIEEPNDD